MEKGGFTLSNSRGFTLIEVLIAAGVVFMLMTTIVPIGSLLAKERVVLNDRRRIIVQLHDELQPFLWNNLTLPKTYTKHINNNMTTFNFMYENKYIKGCATWENARGKNETNCLYGYR